MYMFSCVYLHVYNIKLGKYHNANKVITLKLYFKFFNEMILALLDT